MSLFHYLVFFIVARTIHSIHDESIKQVQEVDIDPDNLSPDPPTEMPADHTDIFHLNVAGEIIVTTRQTLMKISESTLSILFNGDWEDQLSKDPNGNIFFDFNPLLFHHLLDQLQVLEFNSSVQLYPPFRPSLVEPFIRMLGKLGLKQYLSSEKKNVIALNVGGQTITTLRTAFPDLLNSSLDTVVTNSKMMNVDTESDAFLDYDPTLFQHLINQLRKESLTSISSFGLSSKEEKLAFERMLNDLNISVVATTTIRSTIATEAITSPVISLNTKWKPYGVTIAGGNGQGNQLNQLDHPYAMHVDNDDQSVYIADSSNHRIVEWKTDAHVDQVIAGGHGKGAQMNQLDRPTDVILEKKTDSLIICDEGNRRVVQWARRNGLNGQTIISDTDCWGLAMDNSGELYVSDFKKHEVRRWKIGETYGRITAGGYGKGNQLNQLNWPTSLFVDEDQSVYVSEFYNHRVMKWTRDAREAIVVAGGQGQGDALKQLSYPLGVVVDRLGSVYVSDSGNHRIMCWPKGSTEGRVIVGRHGRGQQLNQLSSPYGLSFDQKEHLYVVDYGNHRIQKFDIDSN